MKLVICTNFAQPFHTGGAEKVVQQIAESMVNDFSISCTILTQHGDRKKIHNNVTILPCGHVSESLFIKLLLQESPDCILIYSDWFFRFTTILQHLQQIKCKIILVPVGFNRVRSKNLTNQFVANLLKSNKNRISIVVHADSYADAIYCRENNYPYTIIPNAIDFNEFITKDNFKIKYNIRAEKMLLCVSNFFPGKGQEFLVPIIRNLAKQRSDFALVFISSTLAFQPGNKRRDELQIKCLGENLPVLFLNNIPRPDVIDAFFASDIFVFPSQQEVSPLVVLESMAAAKPWISLSVGNVKDLAGGVVIDTSNNQFGLAEYTDEINEKFYSSIVNLLGDGSLCKSMGETGKRQIIEKYDWRKIKYLYKDQINATYNSSHDSI